MLLGALILVWLATAPKSSGAISGSVPSRAETPGGDGAAGAAGPDASTNPDDLAARGALIFRTDLGPEQGLGPLYNARACVACHSEPEPGGMGSEGLGIVRRVGRVEAGRVDTLDGRGGPIAREHSVAELGYQCSMPTGLPPETNLVSLRNAPALFGLGAVEAIPDQAILAGAAPRDDGVAGRPSLVEVAGRPRVGRFGWKADVVDLEQFVAQALRSEHGVTSPLAPTDLLPGAAGSAGRCAGQGDDPEDDGSLVALLTAFVRTLPAPKAPEAGFEGGGALFAATGCEACHTPALSADGVAVRLYSDLLLHDLGPSLDDGLVQGVAKGRDWRTTPLWGLSRRARYLHDGRAKSLRAAVLAHGGEAQAAVLRFRSLSPVDQETLLAFLSSL